MNMFKKNKSTMKSTKLTYFPERDLKKEPITINDEIQVNAFPVDNAGKDFMNQHMNFINTSISREFVTDLTIKMIDEAKAVNKVFKPGNLVEEEIAVWLAHGYLFAMTESLFGIARKGLISSACKDAINEMVMLAQSEKPGNSKLLLHCLFKGFEISRVNVPAEDE